MVYWKNSHAELEKQRDSALAAQAKRLQDAHQGKLLLVSRFKYNTLTARLQL